VVPKSGFRDFDTAWTAAVAHAGWQDGACGTGTAVAALRRRYQETPMVYASTEPSRAEVDALPGPAVVEFGASWCGICAAAQPLLKNAFAGHPDVRHLKIEDGPGRPLGRSFGIKLWPTLVFLRDGQEVARVVRPRDPQPVLDALQRING
jgi:thioredoxin 1